MLFKVSPTSKVITVTKLRFEKKVVIIHIYQCSFLLDIITYYKKDAHKNL